MRCGSTMWARTRFGGRLFSDANAQRPVAVFTELFAMMMKQAHRGLRRKLAETTYLIDATSARLNERSAGWRGSRPGLRCQSACDLRC